MAGTGLLLGWYSSENLNEKLRCFGSFASGAEPFLEVAWRSSVADLVMPFCERISDRTLLLGTGGADAVLIALLDRAGGPLDRERLLDVRRFLKKPPMPRPRGSASDSEFSREDKSARTSTSVNVEMIEARFEIAGGV